MLVYQRVSWGPYFPKPCHPRHTDLVQLQGLAFQISQAFLEVLAAHLVKPYRSQTTNYELEASQRWSTIYVYLCLFIYLLYIQYIYIYYTHNYAHIWRWKMFQVTCCHSWKLFHHQSLYVDVSRWLLLMDSWNFMNIAILVGQMYDMNHQNWGVPYFQMCLQCDAPVQPPQPPWLRPNTEMGKGWRVGLSPVGTQSVVMNA
jgi:hypothetical protein